MLFTRHWSSHWEWDNSGDKIPALLEVSAPVSSPSKALLWALSRGHISSSNTTTLSPLVVTMLYLIQTMLITTANYLVHISPAYHPLSPPQPLWNIHAIEAGDKSSRVPPCVLNSAGLNWLGAHSFHRTLMARFQRRKPFEQLICFALLVRLMCEIYEEKLKELRSWNWQKRNEIQSGPLATQKTGFWFCETHVQVTASPATSLSSSGMGDVCSDIPL